ncbi:MULTISPECIES: chorismate--pyruvate lyase family protein [unclassified Pseudidiomarina]|uniref:chorismate--pyruvate lyase family protein n=1 Tax=Pseudidiomarina salilacus TaxID=3384452 RepID=UPI0039851DAA
MSFVFPAIDYPVVTHAGEADWHFPTAAEQWPAVVGDWLLDPHSLTAKLKQHSQHFTVQVLGQREAPLLGNETRWLGEIAGGVVREVILWCDYEPWVFARSVFPFQALAAAKLKLEELGDQPLGEHLFNQPDLRRSAVEVSRFAADSKVGRLHQQLGYSAQALWGRRSCFHAAEQQLLVAEVFIGASPLAKHYRETLDV